MPTIISHRGNVNGPSFMENKKSTLISLLSKGIGIEIDLWKIGDILYITHDRPNISSENIELEWLKTNSNNLLIHAKNREVLELLSKHDEFHFFSHENDKYAFTNRGYIIVFPGVQSISSEKTIIMLPELGTEIPKKCAIICTDFVYNYNQFTIDYLAIGSREGAWGL